MTCRRRQILYDAFIVYPACSSNNHTIESFCCSVDYKIRGDGRERIKMILQYDYYYNY